MTGTIFTAGRDNKGAFAVGNQTNATATLTEQVGADPDINISKSLDAFRELLVTVHGIEPKALTLIDEAKQEAAKPVPKREEVQNLVAQATAYARDAAGFAEAADKLKPYLQQIAAWLGSSWQSWAPILGLA